MTAALTGLIAVISTILLMLPTCIKYVSCIMDGVVMQRQGLEWRFGWLLVNEDTLIKECHGHNLAWFGPTSSRHKAFCLLHGVTCDEGVLLSVGFLTLQGRWLWHLLEEHYRGASVPACPSEEWWLLSTVVIDDLLVNVAGLACVSPPSRCSNPWLSTAWVLLLKLSLLLLELSLALLEWF
jgi:hypothetical protein